MEQQAFLQSNQKKCWQSLDPAWLICALEQSFTVLRKRTALVDARPKRVAFDSIEFKGQG